MTTSFDESTLTKCSASHDNRNRRCKKSYHISYHVFICFFQNIDNNLRCCVGKLHCTDLGNRQNIVTLLS